MTPQMILNADIISAINNYAPLSLQEKWDNSGVQLGDVTAPCRGVLLCVDVTEQVVAEAARRGCNLIVSHHPLLFKGLRNITGSTPVERAVIAAIRGGITVYSGHTSLDSAPGGISHCMVRMLGARFESVLEPSAPGAETGLGAVAVFETPLNEDAFVRLVKDTFGSSVCRCSRPAGRNIERLALCGGSGGEFIPRAVASGAQAYLTSDVRYHDFVDHGGDIFIVDIGHYESESCAKQIFYRIISEKFPNFAVYYSQTEQNPINYL